jgi:hypothetical protein
MMVTSYIIKLKTQKEKVFMKKVKGKDQNW